MAKGQYESGENAGHKPQGARRVKRRGRPPFTFSKGHIRKPKRISVLWRLIRRFGRGLLALGLATVFLFAAWVVFRYSSPKLPVNSSTGGIALLVSKPNVSVSLHADFGLKTATPADRGVSGLVTTDATPGRFAVYTLTVMAPVGTRLNILLMLTGNAALDGAFFPPNDQSLTELHSDNYVEFRLGGDDRFRGLYPQAQAFYGSIRVRNKPEETLHVVGYRNRGIVERAGASAAVTLPMVPDPTLTEVEFFNFVPGVWYFPEKLGASVTVGPVPSYMRMEYLSPAPVDETYLTWAADYFSSKGPAPILSPKYTVTDRHEERRLGGLIFLAGVLAGLGGGFMVEGVRDVIDVALGTGSRTETKSQLRRRRYAPHRRRAADRRRRYIPPHTRSRTADRKKTQRIRRAGSQLLKVLVSAFRKRRG
jgi:hypothetical protein